MGNHLRWLIPLALILVILGAYLIPVQHKSMAELYSKVDTDTAKSLMFFRNSYPVETLNVDGVDWEYLVLGQGDEVILFLHGMTGAYDIWWQQLETLQGTYRMISVTYPAVDSLEEMDRAVMVILDAEGVERFHVVGSSLGGYFAQYQVARHPDRILSAVFANTFPPNDILAEKNKTIGTLLPYLPEWLVMNVLRRSMRDNVYPASNYSELVLAFGLEQTYGRMSQAQVLGRYRCVIDPFEAPDVAALGIPAMIIEADNDPLVEKALREQLKTTYPTAKVITLSNGHFPYLSMPDQYTHLLEVFWGTKE